MKLHEPKKILEENLREISGCAENGGEKEDADYI